MIYFKIVNTGISIIGVGRIRPNNKNIKIKFWIFLDKKCIEKANIEENNKTKIIDKDVNKKLLIREDESKSLDLKKIL